MEMLKLNKQAVRSFLHSAFDAVYMLTFGSKREGRNSLKKPTGEANQKCWTVFNIRPYNVNAKEWAKENSSKYGFIVCDWRTNEGEVVCAPSFLSGESYEDSVSRLKERLEKDYIFWSSFKVEDLEKFFGTK
jgi:hypothetical protein